jgi:NADPH2:quinone reductase
LSDGHGADAVIELDLSTNGKDYPNILRPHSTVVVYGDLSAADREACLAELGTLLKSNRLIHTVGRRLPLREATLAHELSERGEVISNIVLDIR